VAVVAVEAALVSAEVVVVAVAAVVVAEVVVVAAVVSLPFGIVTIVRCHGSTPCSTHSAGSSTDQCSLILGHPRTAV
jgi:hypothetical protein